MNSAVTRPLFAEGQIVSAADLDRLSSYPRAREERHNRFVHRWGIVTGLELKTEDAEDAAGNVFKRVFITPGLAVDGEGREVLVTERVPVNESRFRLTIGNSIDPELSYPVFLVSQYRAVASASGPTDPCGQGGGQSNVEEGHVVRFAQPGDVTADQVASAISAAPTEDEGSQEWRILVGFVKWSNDADSFADVDPIEAAKHRPFIGINAETVAGDGGQVMIQPKRDLLPGDAVLQVQQTDDGPQLRFGTFKADGADIEALLSINEKGDVVAKGALTGKRTGNSVQIQTGVASSGIILPLPPGTTQDQVDDGSATVHIQVSPLIDPAHSPEPAADYVALVQECRVDENRRVHCRICWFSLKLGGALAADHGASLVVGPGAVNYFVGVTTIDEGGDS